MQRPSTRAGVLSSLAGLIAIGVVPALACAQPAFQALGLIPNYTAAYLRGISADGSSVAGLTYEAITGRARAFRWNATEGMHLVFEGLPDYTSAAYCVSADGTMIGGWHAPTIIEGNAMVWTAAAGEQQLGTRGFVYALSPSVYAGSIMPGGGGVAPRAAIWTNGHSRFIDLPNMSTSDAYGISADGFIVVGWGAFNSTMPRAFRWTQSTGMQNIGSPDPTGPQSTALAITPDGSTIVGSAQAAPGAPNQAAIWIGPSGVQLLGSLAPGADTAAYAVSGDGRTIVGASGGHAFIWRADRGMEDLQSALGGVVPTGWTLTEARGITPDGLTVAGSAINPGVGIEPWIATLPAGNACYANCDGSTAAPVLNVNDFICFQGRFAAGDTYANCDGSTIPPTLNVNDFVCYLNSFAAGCR